MSYGIYQWLKFGSCGNDSDVIMWPECGTLSADEYCEVQLKYLEKASKWTLSYDYFVKLLFSEYKMNCRTHTRGNFEKDMQVICYLLEKLCWWSLTIASLLCLTHRPKGCVEYTFHTNSVASACPICCRQVLHTDYCSDAVFMWNITGKSKSSWNFMLYWSQSSQMKW